MSSVESCLPGMVFHAVQETAVVEQIREAAANTWIVRLSCPNAAKFITPGQFFMVRRKPEVTHSSVARLRSTTRGPNLRTVRLRELSLGCDHWKDDRDHVSVDRGRASSDLGAFGQWIPDCGLSASDLRRGRNRADSVQSRCA